MSIRIFTTLLLISSIIFSCSDDDDFRYQNNFEQSKKAWLDFKEATNNSYTYTTSFDSWIGSHQETEITVSNGEVIKRSYKYTFPYDDTIEDVEWTEEGDQIGSHEEGDEPMTLDQIYGLAETEWLTKKDNTITYFETKNNGMISLCGYVNKDCADDCFRGITIDSIDSL
ncbi:hypothetical protein C7377_0237 [Balneicella halophila]|uniref:Uncharacterized protein n=1 Tax=Balneicella halophila TaxID=1537566 RepID=A0A7L4UQC4_BALHA|nr:hypothetical protein [Balneicella halophila]PVX51943.1 hypothetical protein C7377_0237 [Balneicella halophila]